MEELQLQAYQAVDKLLDSTKFPEAIEIMRSWSKVWLNQFYLTYPHYYRVLAAVDFKFFWAERRADLDIKIQFVAQKLMPDIDFVLGYVFYLLALSAEKKNESAASFEYLKLALNFNSIHAAQTLLHQMLNPKDENRDKKLKTIAALLYNWESLAAKHRTPGFLLLANGYFQLLKIALELNENSRYDAACFYLWKNLIRAELEEPQSQDSIHNAYFGMGLQLSNPEQISTIAELKARVSPLLCDELTRLRAETSAQHSFAENKSAEQLQAWRQSKKRTSSSKEDSEIPFEELNLNPRL